MGKTAWMFPGQGSQYVGMCREVCDRYEEARLTFAEAEEAADSDLRRVIFDGPEDLLKETRNAQPAIFLASVALSRVLSAMDLSPELIAGHSLGEYSALVTSGSLTFVDALKLVQARAEAMQYACTLKEGAMWAILGLDVPVVEEVCGAISDGIVDIANLNCPGQIVISGEADAVARAAEEAKKRGAKRAMRLAVSGAFHSRLMCPAAERFEPFLRSARLSVPEAEFYPNVSAQVTNEPEEIRRRLGEQLCSPVRWQATIEKMLARGADTFVEVGPGKVLTGLLRRIDGSAIGLNVDTVDCLESIARST